MRSLRDRLNRVNETFNTTLYSSYLYEDEDEVTSNITAETQVIEDFKKILNDSTLTIVQKADKADYLLRKNIKLGSDWRVRGIKDDNGNVFIALRQTYKERRPFNLNVDVTTSRIAFIDTDERGIWVYNGDAKNTWSNAHKEMVEKVLNLLRCKKYTSGDGFEYSLGSVEAPTSNMQQQNNKQGDSVEKDEPQQD